MQPESRRSWLPHWDGETYSRYAAPFYDLTTKLTGWREHLAHSALEGLSPSKLLDVGCGTGYLLNHAVAQGFQCLGIDPSSGMLECALPLPNVTPDMLICASATEIPFPDSHFDIVIASGSLVHVEDISRAAGEMLRVARPGGRLRIIDHLAPKERSWLTPLAGLFSNLSGDILHDYCGHFSSGAKLVEWRTLGRGGYLQRLDFERLN